MEAERQGAAARQAEDLALAEARTKEQHRAIEIARLLKAAQEAEHARLTHEDEEKVELLRREEILLDAQREIANLAKALAHD